MLDNFNRIVQQIRHKPALVQAASASSQANAQASIRATPLAPAVAAVPTVIVQPAVAVVQGSNHAQPNYAPTPTPLAMNGADAQFLRASGFYAGQLSGVLSGPMTLNLQPDGYMGGTVNVTGQAVLVLAGQVNNPNGDFVLSGSSKQGTVMVMGRLDLGTNAMQGNWFLSAGASGAPTPGGSFEVKR